MQSNPLYGTVLRDSKVAQSWPILLRPWQVTLISRPVKSIQINSYLTVSTYRTYRTKKVQISQLSPYQIRLERLIQPKKFSKCKSSLTVKAWTKLSNLYFFGSYKWTRLTRVVKKVR